MADSSTNAAFTSRRSHLVSQIGDSLETVLQQINSLNRSLEGIIEIGNEFASVEALWSQFESVMGRTAMNGEGEGDGGEDQEDGDEGENEDGGEGDTEVKEEAKG